MKFFEAVKQAAFATKLFATAGLSELFAAALNAGDENALKAHLDKFSDEKNALDEAIAENATLSAKVAELNKAAEAHAAIVSQLSTLNAQLSAAGIKFEKPEELGAALNSRISSKARELVAATGGPLLDETPSSDATKPGAKQQPELKGLAKVVAAFTAQTAAKAGRN